MDKRSLTERDICTKFILPAVKRAGWDEMVQVREEVYFTKGRIIVRGKLVTRGKAKKADFVLYYKPNIPIALIEAKDNNHSVGDGMQQGLDYAATLDIPFVFSSNGDGFVFHDRTGRSAADRSEPRPRRLPVAGRSVGALPRLEGPRRRGRADRASGLFRRRQRQGPALLPGERRQRRDRGDRQGPRPRAAGHGDRHGQDLHRVSDHLALWKAGRKKRILFLADRNVLIDQTMVNDFRPFGAAMAKLQPTPRPSSGRTAPNIDLTLALDKKRRIDTAFEVYLGLYQAITGPGGTAEAVSRVLARLLRSDRDRRMPPRQRGRGFGLAGNPRIFLRRQRRSA